ncbi:hypothetical protein EIP86_001899 [Pleurotus ostreatoroseus]|nr:hypothetical protein EIP86_001899 [Pleurotus ostreatoroseus]
MSTPISSNAVSVTLPGAVLRATAADIPIELYALLLSFLITEYGALSFTTSQEERNHVKLNKRELGAISLVCREWALACRPKIFEEIWLFRKEDMDTLFALLDSPSLGTLGSPSLHDAATEASFSADLSGGSHNRDINFSKASVHSAKHPSKASSFHSFPRFRDLLMLHKEMPSLESCACKKVTWDRSQDELPMTIPSPSRRKSNINYRMEDCTDNSAAVWLATALSIAKRNRFLQRDADVLGNTGRALTRHIGTETHSEWFMTAIRQEDTLRTSFTYLFCPTLLTPYIRITMLPYGLFHEVRAVIIDFGIPWPRLPFPQLIANSDWKMIDELFASLPDITFFVLSFASKEDLLLFYESVMKERTPRLYGSSKTKYGLVANGKALADKRRWISCTPGTIDEAADIPIELYALLLSFLITEYTAVALKTPQDERNNVKINKRELSAISLVCREWALVCQPKIFEEIWLRDKEDLDTLCSFLGSPVSCVFLYVRTVWCRHSADVPSPPWIHHACMMLPRKLHYAPIIEVEIKKTATVKQRPFTIQSFLPRQLPAGIVCLKFLSLVDVHLKRFGDLLRPFKELPSLERCSCQGVTWDRSPDELPRTVLSLSRRASYMAYRMEDCTDNSAAVWMAAALSTTKRHRIRQRDADALGNIGCALTRHINAKVYHKWSVACLREGEALHMSAMSYPTSSIADLLTPHMWIALLPVDLFQEVRAFILDFGTPGHKYPLSQIVHNTDWKLLDELFASLGDIKFVVLSFASKEDLLFFHRSVMKEYMPVLYESPKTKYGLVNGMSTVPSERRWIACSPGTVDEDIKRAQWIDHYPW